MREFEGLGFRIRVPSPPATHCPTPTLALAPTITHITTHAHTHTRTPTPTHTHTHSHSSMQTRSILKPYSPMKRDLRTSEVTRYCGQSCPLTPTPTHTCAHTPIPTHPTRTCSRVQTRRKSIPCTKNSQRSRGSQATRYYKNSRKPVDSGLCRADVQGALINDICLH